jgi:hypothetical protein
MNVRRSPPAPQGWHRLRPAAPRQVRYNRTMSPREKVFAEALALPDTERAELASALIASLDGATEGSEQAWSSEIAKRAREVLDGSADLLDYDEVMSELRGLDGE